MINKVVQTLSGLFTPSLLLSENVLNIIIPITTMKAIFNWLVFTYVILPYSLSSYPIKRWRYLEQKTATITAESKEQQLIKL